MILSLNLCDFEEYHTESDRHFKCDISEPVYVDKNGNFYFLFTSIFKYCVRMSRLYISQNKNCELLQNFTKLQLPTFGINQRTEELLNCYLQKVENFDLFYAKYMDKYPPDLCIEVYRYFGDSSEPFPDSKPGEDNYNSLVHLAETEEAKRVLLYNCQKDEGIFMSNLVKVIKFVKDPSLQKELFRMCNLVLLSETKLLLELEEDEFDPELLAEDEPLEEAPLLLSEELQDAEYEATLFVPVSFFGEDDYFF
jgi:hypothetical protein